MAQRRSENLSEILLPYKIAGQFVAGDLDPFCQVDDFCCR